MRRLMHARYGPLIGRHRGCRPASPLHRIHDIAPSISNKAIEMVMVMVMHRYTTGLCRVAGAAALIEVKSNILAGSCRMYLLKNPQ
jgi:hypothetical protein